MRVAPHRISCQLLQRGNGLPSIGFRGHPYVLHRPTSGFQVPYEHCVRVFCRFQVDGSFYKIFYIIHANIFFCILQIYVYEIGRNRNTLELLVFSRDLSRVAYVAIVEKNILIRITDKL